jgi:hypothetical protein
MMTAQPAATAVKGSTSGEPNRRAGIDRKLEGAGEILTRREIRRQRVDDQRKNIDRGATRQIGDECTGEARQDRRLASDH